MNDACIRGAARAAPGRPARQAKHFTRNRRSIDEINSRVDVEGITSNGSSAGRSNYVVNEHTWAVGASGLLGVEWVATKDLSLTGEYALSVEYSAGKFTRTQSYTFNPDRAEMEETTKSFRIYPLSVRFGLSVYF